MSCNYSNCSACKANTPEAFTKEAKRSARTKAVAELLQALLQHTFAITAMRYTWAHVILKSVCALNPNLAHGPPVLSHVQSFCQDGNLYKVGSVKPPNCTAIPFNISTP
eukprot:4884066-Amphidinium_carterae.1